MALINQNSVIGVTSITSPGASNVLTVHTNDTTERLRVSTSGLSFSGTNASLDTSGNLTVGGNVSVGGTLTYEDVTNIDSVGIITAQAGIHVTGGSVGIGTDNPGAQSTSANNLVIAEFGGEGGITIKNDNNSTGHIFFADTDASAQGRIDYGHSGDYMRFYTANTERLRIDSSGRVLIGETSAVLNTTNALLQIGAEQGSNVVLYRDDSGVGNEDSIGLIRFYSNGGSAKEEHARITVISDGASGSGDKPGAMIFYTTPDASATPEERLRIDSAGRITQSGKIASNHGSPNLLLWGADPTMMIASTGSTNNSSFTGIKFAVAGGSTGDYSKAGIFVQRQSTYTDLDMIFAFRSTADAAGVAISDEKLRITSGGEVAIGADAYGNVAPLAKLHVSSTGTTTAIGADHGYLRSSCQILCQASDNADNSKSGIMFSGALHSTDGCSAAVVATHENVVENSETTSLSFYTSHNETLKESLKITSDAQFEMNGVRNIYQSFVLINNTAYNWDFTVPSEGGYGNSFYLVAGYNHYSTTSYGAHRTCWFSSRGTSVNSMGSGIEQSHSQSGNWTFSKPNSTTVRITKTAGTYGGSGYGFFHLMYNHF